MKTVHIDLTVLSSEELSKLLEALGSCRKVHDRELLPAIFLPKGVSTTIHMQDVISYDHDARVMVFLGDRDRKPVMTHTNGFTGSFNIDTPKLGYKDVRAIYLEAIGLGIKVIGAVHADILGIPSRFRYNHKNTDPILSLTVLEHGRIILGTCRNPIDKPMALKEILKMLKGPWYKRIFGG